MGFPSYLEDIEELKNSLEADSREIDSISVSKSHSPEEIRRLSDLVEKKISKCSELIKLAIKAFNRIIQLQQIPEIQYFEQIEMHSSNATRLKNENKFLHNKNKKLSEINSQYENKIKKTKPNH